MSRKLLLVSASLVVVAAAWKRQQDNSQDDGVTEIIESVAEDAAQTFDSWTGGILKISTMAKATPDLLQNRNVRALLRVIRQGEGTSDEAGYRRMFGGATFTSYDDHPRKKNTKWGLTSTAAGAYQFKADTWDETARIMGLKDFTPPSQDLGAVGRIMARGALDDVVNGRFAQAIRKINKEWASMPESPYGQKTMSWADANRIFADAGGVNTGTSYA